MQAYIHLCRPVYLSDRYRIRTIKIIMRKKCNSGSKEPVITSLSEQFFLILVTSPEVCSTHEQLMNVQLISLFTPHDL